MDREKCFLKKGNSAIRAGGIMKKSVICVICILCISLILFAGARSIGRERITSSEGAVNVPQDKTILKLYCASDNSNEMAVLESLCESFMLENKGIEIVIEPSAEGSYNENLKVKEALGEVPDICQIQNPEAFAEAGMIGEMPKEVSDLIKDPIRKDGKVYAVPMYKTTYGIIFNKLIFDRYRLSIPSTYDEFLEVCEALHRHGEKAIVLGGSKIDNLSYWFNYFYQIDVVKKMDNWQIRKNLGTIGFTDSLTTQMMHNYSSLLNSDYVLEDSVNMNDSQIVSNLVQGNVAMVYTGPWLFTQIVEADQNATDYYELGSHDKSGEGRLRVGWFFMPDREGENVVMEIATMNWAISKECSLDEEKRAAASAFLQYYYKKENYRTVLKAANALPITREAVLYPMIGAQQNLLVSYRYADKSTEYYGNYQTPEAFDSILYTTLRSVATGTESGEDALEYLDEAWDELMLKNKKD